MERQKKQGSDVKRENDRGKKTKNEWGAGKLAPFSLGDYWIQDTKWVAGQDGDGSSEDEKRICTHGLRTVKKLSRRRRLWYNAFKLKGREAAQLETYEIRPLSLDEVRDVYHLRMVHDFPRNELKSLGMIEKALKRGNYRCLGMQGGNAILAYAFFVKLESNYLLDYFAVDQNRRGSGLGNFFSPETV